MGNSRVPPHRGGWATLRGLLRYARREKGGIALALFVSVLAVLVELIRPWPIQVVVDYVLLERSPPAWIDFLGNILPGANSREGLLVWSVVALVLVVITAAILSWLALTITTMVAQRLVYALSMDLFATLQRLSLTYHQRHPLGDLLQRVSGDSYVVYFLVANVMIPAVVASIALVGMFAILARLDLGLALLALGVVPFLVASLGLFLKPMESTTERQWAAQGATMSLIEQCLSAVRIIQGFGRETFVQQKVERSARVMSETYGTAVRVSHAYAQLSTAITGIATAILLGFGGMRVVDGDLSVGELTVFLGYLAALYGPVNQLTTAAGYAVQVVTRGRRVFDILDATDMVRERTYPIDLDRPWGHVRFENVSFGYGAVDSGNSPILRDVSFTAMAGQVTALVGATGTGKTSLISLLSRFHDPWAGRVLIDGHDARDLRLRSLRDNVSVVLQEPYLFPVSLADNIGFGRIGASRADIVRAARLAYAHDFIERLPHGYDTEIGERGATLSGGERQRIALARAILKDAPILIMDEPTSALDAATEAQIFASLRRLMHHKTTFIISHRLSTIHWADQILTLQDGRIVEQGTHQALMAQEGVYQNLYRHQGPVIN